MDDSEQLFSLRDTTVLVTGGSSGLGLAIARGMIAAGATVIVGSRDTDRAAAAAAGIGTDRVSGVAVDVSDRASVDTAVAGVLAAHGRIDVLVNSAGIGGRSPAEDCAVDLWQRVLDVNLTGTFHCCQAVGRAMLGAGTGSIINVASIGGVVGIPGSAAYQASKGGVVQLTRALAVEWAARGVRVNAIAPSQFETPLVQRQWDAEPALRAAFVARTPVGRIGRVDEIVGPAVFLASRAASMVTGHVMMVDGGYTAQ